MNSYNHVHNVHAPERARRDFLKKSSSLAIPMILGGIALPAMAAYVPPTRTRGTALLNVRNYGAYGDGVHDDTAAIQKTINSLPSTGGTVYVPAGTYLVDAVTSIRPRSLMLLQLDPGAKLVAKPNSVEKSYVVYAYKIKDFEIAGGQIVGERDGHLGTTGEWGHCIFVRGCERVTVRDIRLSKGWGDGISVGAALVYNADPIISKDVVIANIVSTGNRRQGLSIGRVAGIKVYDSEFSYSKGTAPECGLDIEPDDPGTASSIWIENCRFNNNNKYGVNIYKRSSGMTFKGCTIESNGSCGFVTTGCSTISFTGNLIQNNSATGVYIQDGTQYATISGNTFFNNYRRLGDKDRIDFTMSGTSTKNSRDILVRGTVTGISILSNYYK
ncbi:MAG TPA: right-handed parallel beta-helix repeat-containing protein [Lysobacter sp.]|jgi:parallel beta-helix repeat protein|nr:right-handed parallel beta-helix repeat-containing protein [Lysobacter sp.]